MWAAACPARLQLAPLRAPGGLRAAGSRSGLLQRRPASRRARRPAFNPVPIRASGAGSEDSAGGSDWVLPPRAAFKLAEKEAQRLGHDSVTPAHLLLGILQTNGARLHCNQRCPYLDDVDTALCSAD